MAQESEPPPIVIRQLEPLPTQVASKNPILFNQVRQGPSLLASQPTSQDHEHHLESRRVDHNGSLNHAVRMVLFPRRRPNCGTLRALRESIAVPSFAVCSGDGSCPTERPVHVLMKLVSD
jgi:hypothetical protein